MKNIIFIGSGKDFHGIDWYRSIKKICTSQDISYATDLIESEGELKIIKEDDVIIELFNIDWLLFSKRSPAGDTWRNIVKILAFPLQVVRLKALAKKNSNAIFHAHTMYYLFLCWLAGIKFIGSPQGSEILSRPYRSKLYKFFAKKSLLAADKIIIDSLSLQNGILNLCGKSSSIIQYGIDVLGIQQTINKAVRRKQVVSVRGMYPIYRIEEILKARNYSRQKPALTFSYPFWEDAYKDKMLQLLEPNDQNLGRLPEKTDLYKLLNGALLVISIPKTDSSPRSVYEGIFCGCCIAVTYNIWIESLPKCMRSRIVIVDLGDNLWMEKAIEQAKVITDKPYIASDQALKLFDQRESMKVAAEQFYGCA